jgi:hypothetical protein
MTGTVHDNKTGLTWQQTVPSAKYTWGSASTSGTAQNYCANLILNGIPSWRLPTMKELLTILDYSVGGPAIDATYFPNTPRNYFWSSTPTAGSSNDAWIVDFNVGDTGGGEGAGNTLNVRCVR